mgnify:CR=1 FL=1
MGPFVQVVLGQIISLFGNAALRFVLPLILLRQTGSAAVYGAATALALLPALAGTLAGGVLADRCRKARLMVVLDLAAAGLALGAAASADDLPTVLWAPAALCALYALQGLYQPVVRASLPLLLAGDRLVQGNAVIQLVDTLDELLGPLLGSALLGVMGLGPLLVLCGACFAASALLEWQIRIPGDRPQPCTQRKPDFAADLRESLTYLYHSRPELLRLAGIMALVNLVEIPAVVVGIPVVIVQYLGQSDAVLGAVQAVLSVGGLAGGALAGHSRHPLSDRQALGLLLGIAGLCAAMVPVVGAISYILPLFVVKIGPWADEIGPAWLAKLDSLLTCRISLAWAAYRMYDIKVAGQMLMDWPAIDNIFVYFLYQFGPVLVVLAGILMAVTLYRLARHGRWQAAACLLVVLFYGYMETQVIHITSNPALLLLVPAVFGDSLSD